MRTVAQRRPDCIQAAEEIVLEWQYGNYPEAGFEERRTQVTFDQTLFLEPSFRVRPLTQQTGAPAFRLDEYEGSIRRLWRLT
jgi:hypothetical protein